MKTLFALFIALGLTVPVATAAFAGPEDCAEGQSWDEATESCVGGSE